jgi:tetratricopeptide (TPR) repeat protein
LLLQEIIWAEMLNDPAWTHFHAEQHAAGQILPPSKMESVVQARLAQLSTQARHLVGLAATIGRFFSFSLLRQGSGENENSLVTALDELWQRRIVREHGNDSYDFSHDKIREVAYAGISPIWRRRFHLQVAKALEELYRSKLHTVSARIATHYRDAGESAKAATYYYRAADEMHFGFAHSETLAHLEQGLTMLQGQPRTDENSALEIAMRVATGRILTAREGWGSPGAIAAFESAYQLCIETHNVTQLVRVQDYLQIAYSEHGNLALAIERAKSNLALTIQLGNQADRAGAHGSLGYLLLFIGNLAEAREQLELAATVTASLPETQAHVQRAFIYPGAFPYALVLWLLGYPQRAQQYLVEVLAAQESQVGPFDRMTAYEFCIMFHHWNGDLHEMRRYAQKMLALSEQYEYTFYQWLAEIYEAVATATLGEKSTDITFLRQKVDAIIARGTLMHIPFCLLLLAGICTKVGGGAEAISVLNEVLAMMAETGEHLWEAETWLMVGDLHAAQGATLEADSSYRRALKVARHQQAKVFELRAALRLGRSLQAQGKYNAAIELLAPIYHQFSEGSATQDLSEAQLLLAILPE